MKIKLKVLDRTLPRLNNNEDDRWNTKIEIEIDEKIILNLVDQITDEIYSDNNYFIIDPINRLRVFNEIDKIIRSARAWKSIHSMLANKGLETSRFTRLSLFQELLNQTKIEKSIREKIQEKSTGKAPAKLKSESKQTQRAPSENPIETISQNVLENFLKI